MKAIIVRAVGILSFNKIRGQSPAYGQPSLRWWWTPCTDSSRSMKHLLPLLLLISGCTSIPTPHGKAFFAGDYTGVTLDDGPVHFHADSMQHSPIYTSAGAMGGNLIGSTGAAFTGYKLASTGATTATRAMGVFAPAAAIVPNRHANRATPRPVLVTPAGKVLQPNVP